MGSLGSVFWVLGTTCTSNVFLHGLCNGSVHLGLAGDEMYPTEFEVQLPFRDIITGVQGPNFSGSLDR